MSITLPSDSYLKIFVGNEEIREFNPSKLNYKRVLGYNAKKAPTVSALLTVRGKKEKTVITQAESPLSVAKIYIPCFDITYTVEFSKIYKEIVKRKYPLTDNVKIEKDAFWSERLSLYADTTTKYALQKLKEQGALANFESVIKKEGEPLSTPWEDGLLFETIAGAADFLLTNRDSELEAIIDEAVDTVFNASMSSENGYLSTHAMLTKPGCYFDKTGNAVFLHDCYNLGCIVEGGMKYYKATGNIKLLFAAIRYLEFTAENYGYGRTSSGKEKEGMVPSHSLPEETITELYSLLKEDSELVEKLNSFSEKYPLSIDPEKYKELVLYFVENRGNDAKRSPLYGRYAQDRLFYFDQTEAEGHAVRANLFYTGLAAAGYEFDNPSYLGAAKTLFDNIYEKQMYINGSTGSTEKDEAFGGDYVLPNGGYCETCASVALAFFAHRMSLSFIDPVYAETIENILYNAVLGGISLDGKKFYYIQPLNSTHNTRWSWNGCPCCVPMFLKFMSRIGTYIYSYDKNRIFVNQFISSSAELDGTTIKQSASMPFDGVGEISVLGKSKKLFVRIPTYAKKCEFSVNGKSTSHLTEDGFAVFSLKDGDVLSYRFVFEAKRQYSDERVLANRGRTALKYGPVLYTVEWADNKDFDGACESEDAIIIPKDSSLDVGRSELFGGTVTISFDAKDIGGNKRRATAIPYSFRDNREEGFSYTWLKED